MNYIKLITHIFKRIVLFFIRLPSVFPMLIHFILFFILLISFLCGKFYLALCHIPLLGLLFIPGKILWSKTLEPAYLRLLALIDTTKNAEVSRSYLIHVGYKNLMEKKARSLVTILGMSVGIGVIVLLLSLGYGIEKLIIGKVASLNELKIIDVSTGENTALRLNSKAYSKIKQIKGVNMVMPIISIVGRISFNKATTDVVVYAASRSYLESTRVKLKKGALFASKLLDKPIEDVSGVTSHVTQASFNTPVNNNKIYFDVIPGEEIPAWSECSVQSNIEGYISRLQGGYSGREYWGSYDETLDWNTITVDNQTGSYLSKWIKAEMPMYDSTSSGKLEAQLDQQAKPVYKQVCIQEKYTQKLDEYNFAEVLGESTDSAQLDELNDTLAASDSSVVVLANNEESSSSGKVEFVTLESSSAASLQKPSILEFKGEPSHEAVVSLGLLKLLGLSESKAIGTSFKVSFIVSKSLYPQSNGKIFTKEEEYKIVGVIDDEESQYFYIPFADTQQLGIQNYSQLKVVVDDKGTLSQIRKQIETFGFKTASTVDTVQQIESLFNNLRIILVLLGMVALGVASLGMFNTLTVSLLERTREIGGMKTMGMVSSEVQDLFLAEAMIMGLSGGVGGVVLGFVTGKLLSFLVSLIAFSQGQGYLELTYVPGYLVTVIVVFSFLVGVLTGIYPAQRAKKISALNALRYE